MSNIAVFGGTVEGRLIAEAFQNTKLNIHICVATEYGAELLPDCSNIHIHQGRMNEAEMEKFLSELSVDYCLDATHPYAAQVTENIYNACKNIGLSYIRVLRKEGNIDCDNHVIYKESIDEAVEFLNGTRGNILITTGSRDLERYTAIDDYKERCFARVLPTLSVIEKCKELGFEGKNVIAMQGPFSEELNYCILKQIEASWLVTKNSGKEGGYQHKCEAALRAGVNIIVIGRVEEKADDVKDLAEAIDFIKKNYSLEEKRKVYLIGMGPGSQNLLTKEAEECLNKCDVVIGAKRVIDVCPVTKPFYNSYNKEDILSFIEEHFEYKNIAIVYSGDIGFYSGAKGMNEKLKEYEVHYISGISSPIYFLNKLGIAWDNVKLVSCHGQNVNLIPLIRENKRVCALLGKKSAVSEICERLIEFGMSDISITVGERLSYNDEKITAGVPVDFIDKEVDTLSIILFENTKPCGKIGYGIKDSNFIRGNVPMTKEEIRVISLSKLGLKRDSVLYDIGAGTGSVSVEAALQCNEGYVYAIEKNSEGIDLIIENRNKFKTENIEIVKGVAPNCMADLPKPSHAFIGGSSGKIIDIIRAVRAKNEDVRFVINIVTLETLAMVEDIKSEFPQYENMEIVQINVARSKALGKYHLMSAENPVYIISFGGEEYGK